MAQVKTTGDQTALALLQSTLTDRVKEQLYQSILETLVEGFKADIAPHIREEVEKLVFGRFETYRDFYRLRDELVLHIKWTESNGLQEKK